jgi:hypothetical protein
MSFPTSPTNGQQATVNGIVYNYNSTKGAWIKNVTTAGTLTTGNLVITSNIASTSTLNGALTIAGGAGITGNITAGGSLEVPGRAILGSGTTSNVVVAATTTSTSTTTGALVVRGGVGAAGNIIISGDVQTTAAGFGSVSSRFTANTAVKGDIHITPPGNGANATSTLQYGITFSPGGNVSNTQGAILIAENGSDGTAIGFYTTNSYASGPQLRASISPTGAFDVASRGITRGSMPPGSILQVVHVTKTNTFAGTSVLDNGGYFVDVTGMSATITPTSSTSTILILTNLYIGVTNTAGGYQQNFRLKRTISATVTFPILGDAEGGRPRTTGRVNNYLNTTAAQYQMSMLSGTHQDSPATTSAITYQVQIGGYSGGTAVYLNRAETFQVSANDYDNVPVSTITLMEIAA